MAHAVFAIGTVSAEYRANEEPLERVVELVERRLTHELGGEEGLNELVILAVRGPGSAARMQREIMAAFGGDE